MNKITRLLVLAVLPVALAACAVAPRKNDLNFDPYEGSNRRAHAVNKSVDRAAFGPVARGYGRTMPEPIRHGITNVHTNWLLPAQAIQYTLQGKGGRVVEATSRFLVNTTIGIAGLFDVATKMKLPYRETNFDETFYTWGIPEGGYLELPIGGPGTQRDWTGYVLDQVSDPTYYLLPTAATTGLLVASGLDLVNDRYILDPVIQELYYNSTDSYTATRISYLQNMWARLGGGTNIDTLEDVYADDN